MSKHSMPMDQKIQKDWADVMQQFDLPVDKISYATEIADHHNEQSTILKGPETKEYEACFIKPAKKSFPKAGITTFAFLSICAIAATTLYSNSDASLNAFNKLLASTTTSSSSAQVTHTENSSNKALNLVSTPAEISSKTSSADKTEQAKTETADQELKPKYLTLTKDLDLSTLETLSADTAFDTNVLEEKNWKTYILTPKSKLSTALNKIGVNNKEISKLRSIANINKELDKVGKGYILRAEKKKGKLSQLITYKINAKRSFVISKNEDKDKYTGAFERKVIETRQTRRTLFIKNSLRYDANQENLSHKIVQLVTKIFDRDVKLARDLDKGDRITVVYEQIFHRGNKIAEGDISAAELMHKGRIHRAIRFAYNDNKADYFDSKGYDLSNAFKRHPLTSYKRISSHYGKRRHPVYKRIRMHTGVDYAADKGTPVSVTANGVVQHVARKGGYGKTIIIKHSNGYSTLYGHLSKYKKDLKPGQKVYLGDVIGYVGSTGRSTGNHLHYEVRINSIPKDPLKIQLPKTLSLDVAERRKFIEHSRNLVRQLDVLQRFANEKVDIQSGFGG